MHTNHADDNWSVEQHLIFICGIYHISVLLDVLAATSIVFSLGTHTFTTLSLPNFVPGDISL
jgi:hypothetical protein